MWILLLTGLEHAPQTMTELYRRVLGLALTGFAGIIQNI